MCMVTEQCDLGVVAFSEPIFCLLQVEASRALNGATVLLWRKHCVSKQNAAAPHGWRSHGVVQLQLLKQTMFLSPSLPLLLRFSASCSTPCLVSVCCFVLVFLLYLTLFYFFIFFLDFASSNVPISLIFLLLFLFNSRHAFRPPTWLPPPPVPLFP